MAKAKKTKAGSWRVQLYLGRDPNGKQIIKSITAPTKREAEAKALEYKTRGVVPSRDTVQTAISEYIQIRAAVLSPATLRNYKAIERALLKRFPVLMATKVDAVDDRKAQSLLNELTKVYAPDSVRFYFDLFEMAMRARGIRFTTCTRPACPKKERHIPTAEEAREILKAAHGTTLEIPILLAACGLRAGEICALSPEDITGDVVHIHRAKVSGPDGKYQTKSPKTASSDRYIKIPMELADMIRKRGYVAKVRPDSLSDMHRIFLKRHGFQHFRLHDWRHYMASSLHAIGCSDAFIQAQGGWASDYTMKRVYRHLLEDSAAAMADKATANVAAIMPSDKPDLKLVVS